VVGSAWSLGPGSGGLASVLASSTYALRVSLPIVNASMIRPSGKAAATMDTRPSWWEIAVGFFPSSSRLLRAIALMRVAKRWKWCSMNASVRQ
jgi:hypothetical protein